MDYTSPQTLLNAGPQSLGELGVNPMALGLSGLQTAYGIGGMNASQRDQDLQYQMEQNKYQQQLLDNPNLASKRALEMAQNKFNTDVVNSPEQKAATYGELGAKAATSQTTEAYSKKDRQGMWALEARDRLQPFVDPQTKQLNVLGAMETWKELQKSAKDMHVNDPGDTVDAEKYQRIGSFANNYINNREQIQALVKQAQINATHENVANIGAGATKYASDAAQRREEAFPSSDVVLAGSIKRYQNGTATPADTNLVALYGMRQTGIDTSKDMLRTYQQVIAEEDLKKAVASGNKDAIAAAQKKLDDLQKNNPTRNIQNSPVQNPTSQPQSQSTPIDPKKNYTSEEVVSKKIEGQPGDTIFINGKPHKWTINGDGQGHSGWMPIK